MSNCQNCKFVQSLPHKLVGCAKHRKIILKPEEEKSCYQEIDMKDWFENIMKGFATQQ